MLLLLSLLCVRMNRKKGEKCYPFRDLGCETCKLGSENTLVSFQIIEILYLFYLRRTPSLVIHYQILGWKVKLIK